MAIKAAIKFQIGDKSERFKKRIIAYVSAHPDAKTQDISLEIGLKLSRTRDYLSELFEEGKIIAHGANKNRTYSVKLES